MPINAYNGTKKQAEEQELPTQERDLRKAYDVALDGTKAGGRLVNLGALANDTHGRSPGRDAFKRTFADTFRTSTQEYLGAAGAHWDGFQADAAQAGTYGTTEAQFLNEIEAKKEDFTFDALVKAAANGIKQVKERLGARIQSQLTEADRDAVLQHVGVDPAQVYADRIGAGNLAQLLDMFEQLGVIPPKVLEKQPYFRH